MIFMLININDYGLSVKELRGQRVVTFKDIDEVHKRPTGTAGRNFRANRNRLIETEDYYSLTGDALKEFKQATNIVGSTAKELILITETGYLMLVKSFNDDLAWQVQRQLVKSYFRAKETITQQKSNPLWQEARRQSISCRLRETDELKRYVEYCRSNGSRNAEHYYVTYTNLVNKAVGLGTDQRDIASADVLQIVSILESTIQRTLADELARETEYHMIYNICKEKVFGIMKFLYLPERKLLPVV